MDNWLPDFSAEVQRLLGYSPTTAGAYNGDIRRFWQYLRQKYGEAIPPERLGPQDVLDFLQAEAQKGRRRATLQRRIAALRVLERCLLLKKRIDKPFLPSEEQIVPVLQQGRPSRVSACLQTEHLQRLWQTLLASPKRQAVRDLALIALLAEWGLALSTLLDLQVYQVDEKSRSLWLPQISGMDTPWELQASWQPLLRYVKQGRQDLGPRPGETHLFISQQGRPLSRQTVWHTLRTWGQAAGLELTLTPRVLRHTAAYRMLSQGLPATTIGKVMGHSNPLSTSLLIRRLKEHCTGVPPAEIPLLPE